MPAVYRIYTEKKENFNAKAQNVLEELTHVLGLPKLRLRMLTRYDVESITEEDFEAAKGILCSPISDNLLAALPEDAAFTFTTEDLPGQYNQLEDSAEQAIALLTLKERPVVKSATVYLFYGELLPQQKDDIVAYLLNPIEKRLASFELPNTIIPAYAKPEKVPVLQGFCSLPVDKLEEFISEQGLTMDMADILFCQNYFKNTEHREPTLTEVKILDTYWSDHCRHSTFNTHLDNVDIDCDYIEQSYQKYLALKAEIGHSERPTTMMHLATIGARALSRAGLLPMLDVSEEVNACSVNIKVNTTAGEENWLLMFKNETHNHPTEMEPFGGAATCLGGGIRDPLSGRGYVYQAMRITGAENPLTPIKNTLKGKLPQRKIVTTAMKGYSSYGNQIGAASGHITEIYHPGYVAKRMELGALVAATPKENVVRLAPNPGDIVLLVGAKTGRDGVGGAAGSSKQHTENSLESGGAEVQKGDPIEERKIVRLFRNGEYSRLIKRCNDFGAGGVSVAIGELADGLEINLDAVPVKYPGLGGTELALSESQERMACVIAPENLEKFTRGAEAEGLEVAAVAVVSENPRMVIRWQGDIIADISREFLNSSGAAKHSNIKVAAPVLHTPEQKTNPTLEEAKAHLASLNVASQKGLVERFDSTVGAGTVLNPLGGSRQLTPAQVMAAKIPVLCGDTTTASIMGWGFDPFISAQSPYHGAMLAVLESVTKVVAAGGSYKNCYLSFQEFFEKLGNNPQKWGKPFSALLGALEAQMALECAAIGGKDSMSGTFEDIDVPPTLVSFAVCAAEVQNIISPEFKKAGNKVYLIKPDYNENKTPNFVSVKELLSKTEENIKSGKIISAWSIGAGGILEGIVKMAVGNRLGFAFANSQNALFAPLYGSIIVETAAPLGFGTLLGEVTAEYTLKNSGECFDMAVLEESWKNGLAEVYPAHKLTKEDSLKLFTTQENKKLYTSSTKTAKPHALMVVMPGTHGEYDATKAFEQAGAQTETFIVRNRTAADIKESINGLAAVISRSQIVVLPAGAAGGDEPDGAAKFFDIVFRHKQVADAVEKHLTANDGLILGIGNGFQALVRLGLIPYGKICGLSSTDLAFAPNISALHHSTFVNVKVTSGNSPWHLLTEVGDTFTLPFSSGEGRLVITEPMLKSLIKNDQIMTQYVNEAGMPSMLSQFNPAGSMFAVESLCSPCKRVLGTMANFERTGQNLFKNIPNASFMPIAKSAVEYFNK